MRKYLTRRIEEPGILIFKEKHGTRYFICNSPQDFCKAALKVLAERLKEGYWYADEEDDSLNQNAADYAGMVRNIQETRKDKTLARAIVKKKDTEAAFEFMDYRSDYEYEAMKIEYGETY